MFWLPALADAGLVNIRAAGRGMFVFAEHFVPWRDLLAVAPRLDRAALNPPLPHTLGWAQLVLAAVGLVSLHPRFGLGRRARGHVWLGLAGLVACVFVTQPVSAPLWRAVPLVRLIQFPWRYVGMAEVCLLPLVAAAWAGVPPRLRPVALPIGVALPLVAALPLLYPLRPPLDLGTVTPADAVRYELATSALGTTSSSEYLPRTVRERPPRVSPPPEALAAYARWRPWLGVDPTSVPPGVDVRIDGATVRLGPGNAFALRLHQFYFPGWWATVNAARADVAPSEPGGLVTVAVPAASAPRVVRAGYAGDGLARAAGWLSLAALLATLVVAARAGWNRARRRAADGGTETPSVAPDGAVGRGAVRGGTGDLGSRAALAIAAGAVAFTLLDQGFVAPRTDWLRPRSDPGQPLGMQHPVHVRLGETVEVVGYDVDRAAAGQGDAVRVRVYWRALRPLDVNYHPFVHLDRPDGTGTWANSTTSMPGSAPTSRWPTDQYVVDDHVLTVPPEAPPIVGRLTAGLIADTTGAALTTADGVGAVVLGPLRVTGAWPERTDRVPPGSARYRLGDAIELVGADATRAGGGVVVRLWWRASASVDRAYTVFVHVLDASGNRVAQGDGPPVDGLYPTDQWLRGQVVPDRVRVPLEPGVTGPFTVLVGLYDPATMGRLPLTDAQQHRLADDALRIRVP